MLEIVPWARTCHEGLLLAHRVQEDVPVRHGNDHRIDHVGRVRGLAHVIVHDRVPRSINTSASNKHGC